jgi:hypothetical protein
MNLLLTGNTVRNFSLFAMVMERIIAQKRLFQQRLPATPACG